MFVKRPKNRNRYALWLGFLLIDMIRYRFCCWIPVLSNKHANCCILKLLNGIIEFVNSQWFDLDIICGCGPPLRWFDLQQYELCSVHVQDFLIISLQVVKNPIPWSILSVTSFTLVPALMMLSLSHLIEIDLGLGTYTQANDRGMLLPSSALICSCCFWVHCFVDRMLALADWTAKHTWK